MALDRKTAVEQPAIRALTKQEIDRRIRGLIEEIALPPDGRAEAGSEASERLRPRWIHPAELVRRLSRFIVHN